MTDRIQIRGLFDWLLPRPTTDPAIMQALKEMTSQLTSLRRLEESKIPTGAKNIVITVSTDVTEYELRPRWISFSVANDGPDGLVAWINDKTVPSVQDVIPSGGTLGIDMVYPVIKTLYLKSSGSSAVRVYGSEGVAPWEE